MNQLESILVEGSRRRNNMLSKEYLETFITTKINVRTEARNFEKKIAKKNSNRKTRFCARIEASMSFLVLKHLKKNK